jgi:hypothetical protein
MGKRRLPGRLARGIATALTVLGIVVATAVGLDSWAEAAATQGIPASGALSVPRA